MTKQIEEKVNKQTKVSPDDAPIMKKSKFPISIITAILAIVAGVGAFYFISTQKDLKIDDATNPEIVEKSEKSEEIEKNLKIENINFGYRGNLELEMKIPKEKVEGNLKLEDFQILYMDKGLRSVFSFKELSGIGKEDGNDPVELLVNNFDITTNEEVTYINLEGDQLKAFLGNIIQNSELMDSIFNSEKFLKIDAAKPLIDLLGSNDELLNSFIKGLVSSNPIHYWEKYGVTEKARKKFLSKNSYKFFFKDLETKDGKTYIGLKDSACEFAIKTAEKMKIPFPMNVEECNTQLVMVNDNLGKVLYITQDGDTESINYNDEINKITLSYNNGEIVLFTLESPMGPAINYESKILTIKYDSGKLGEQIGMTAKLDSTFDFEKSSFKIGGNYKLGDNELKISGAGNQEKGKIGYMFTEKGVVVSKGQYQYSGGNHGLNITGPLAEINGKLLNSEEKKQWQFSGKWGKGFENEEKKENISAIYSIMKMYYDDEGNFPTEGLTPIKYKGEIIAYQGESIPYLSGGLFDPYLSSIPTNPDGKDNIISISADATKFSIATVIEENGQLINYIKGNTGSEDSYYYSSSEETGTSSLEIKLKNEEVLNLNSLIYEGEYIDGVYSIIETELETENDLVNFITNSDTKNLVYSLEKSKANDFNNSITSKGLLEYNGSGEINTAVISTKADYISGSWSPKKVSTSANISLKDSNLQLSIKHNEREKEVLSIDGKGTWGVNNTDVNLVIKADGETIPVTLKHENGVAKSTVDFELFNLNFNSEISSNNPFMTIVGAIGNIYSISIFQQYVDLVSRDSDSIRVGDIGAIERSFSTWQSDYEGNPDGAFPTEGLTPISYQGEVIAYQGNFSDYFNGALKDDGFDVLQKSLKDPDGVNDYIISISADGKNYSIAATLENKGTSETQKGWILSSWNELELENGEILDIKSIIYEQADGKPKKTELETEEDLAGFLKDGDTRAIYTIVENDNKEDKNIIDLKYNTTKEGSNSIIDGSYIISKGEEEVVSISLKGNISTEGFTYSIPTDVEEIDWISFVKLEDNGGYNDLEPKYGLEDYNENRSEDEVRKDNINSIKMALTTWMSDYELNATGTLPIDGLTPISYQGEIIAYQGDFNSYFNGSLKEDGFDVLQNVLRDPDGINDYIVSISADGRHFSIATTLENNGETKTSVVLWAGSNYGEIVSEIKIELESEEILVINSFVYEQENGKPTKTELESEEDLAGFLKDGDTDKFPYLLNN